MRIRSVFSHSAQAIAEGALISVLVVGLMAGTAFAAKPAAGTGGHNSGGGTIALVMVTEVNGNGLPNFSDTVVFNVSTTATTQPFVNLQCLQNGALVLNGWNGYFAGALNSTWNFGLNSGAWQGGAADCTAFLDMATKRGWSQLASTSFHVDA